MYEQVTKSTYQSLELYLFIFAQIPLKSIFVVLCFKRTILSVNRQTVGSVDAVVIKNLIYLIQTANFVFCFKNIFTLVWEASNFKLSLLEQVHNILFACLESTMLNGSFYCFRHHTCCIKRQRHVGAFFQFSVLTSLFFVAFQLY